MGRRFLDLLAPNGESRNKIRAVKRYEYWISDKLGEIHIGVFYTSYTNPVKVKRILEKETSLKLSLCKDVRYWKIE